MLDIIIIAVLLQLAKDFDIVVNCSGLGAKELMSDEKCFPIRGQLLRVIYLILFKSNLTPYWRIGLKWVNTAKFTFVETVKINFKVH